MSQSKKKSKSLGIIKFFKGLVSPPERDPQAWRRTMVPVGEYNQSPGDLHADRLATNTGSPVTYEQHASATAHHISQAFKKKALESSNFISNSKQFKQILKSTFDSIDIDKSGTLDHKELYIGVLTVYLQLAKVVVGLVPPTQQDVLDLMKQCDTNGDGVVDLDEFNALISILLSNIVGRVIMQALFQLLFIPALAALLVEYLTGVASGGVQEVLSQLPTGLVVTVMSILISLLIIAPLLQAVDASIKKLFLYRQKKKL